MESYVGEDDVNNSINSMIEGNKYCSDLMKKHFNKRIMMTKKDVLDFQNSTKYWIWENVYVDNDVKVRDHCHIIEKYRGSAYRDCNINVKLIYKVPVVFHNLKNCDLHLFMEEQGKFNFKKMYNKWIRKHMTFYINNELIFL